MLIRVLPPLLLAALCAVTSPGYAVRMDGSAPAAVEDPDPERFLEVLVELRFGRLVARTIPAFQYRDIALLPLSDFFRLADYRYHRADDSTMTVILQPQDHTVEFDLRKDYLDVGGRIIALGPDDMILRDGVIYLATGPLGDLLGIQFLVNWQELSVAIEDPSPLPVVQQIQRAARRRALARSQTVFQPELELTAPRRGVNGFVLNYSALLPSSSVLDNSAFSLGVGANVIGGSLELTTRTIGTGTDRYAQFRGAWTGFWPNDPMLRQLRVGDAISTGPRPRMIRGMSLTNVPFFRPPDFGFADYRGRLPPGWEIEAYRNGELVGFDSTSVGDGFSFHLPVERGQNAVDFVAYGPFGEVRRFNQTYQIGQILLPEGDFEYGVSAGACQTALCQGTMNADFRYGITQRITVGGGIDRYWREQSGDLNHPYARIGGSPVNALTLEFTGAANAFTRAAVRVEPSINARFLLERFDYDRDVVDPIISPANTNTRTSVSAFLRPVNWHRNLYFDARVDRFDRDLGRTTRGRLAMSASVRNVNLIPFLRVEHEDLLAASSNVRTFTGLDVIALPQRRLGSVFGSLTFRGGVEFQDASRITQAGFSLFKTYRTGIRLEAGMEWNEFQQGTTFRFGITSTLGGVFASLQSVVPPSGPSETLAQLQGSAAWNPEARAFTLSPVGTFQQSGITGVVFLDENANGLRDPGEPGLPDARIIIGYSTVRSDSAGRYQAWEASPFEAAIVSVDSLSLSNPLWVPLYRSISVAPGPNAFMDVDLPVVESAVIEGRVVSRGGRHVQVAFVPLLLINRLTGEETRLTTFSDGEFYQMGVRPGEYELRVDETRQPGVVSVGSVVRFSVQPMPGGTTIDDIQLDIQADDPPLP